MAKERDFERVTIRKRKGGRWYARFREGGRRIEINLQLTNKVRAVGVATRSHPSRRTHFRRTAGGLPGQGVELVGEHSTTSS